MGKLCIHWNVGRVSDWAVEQSSSVWALNWNFWGMFGKDVSWLKKGFIMKDTIEFFIKAWIEKLQNDGTGGRKGKLNIV